MFFTIGINYPHNSLSRSIIGAFLLLFVLFLYLIFFLLWWLIFREIYLRVQLSIHFCYCNRLSENYLSRSIIGEFFGTTIHYPYNIYFGDRFSTQFSWIFLLLQSIIRSIFVIWGSIFHVHFLSCWICQYDVYYYRQKYPCSVLLWRPFSVYFLSCSFVRAIFIIVTDYKQNSLARSIIGTFFVTTIDYPCNVLLWRSILSSILFCDWLSAHFFIIIDYRAIF